ncbi:MAG TPA: hypothetical protein ENI87_06020 [bacterium]|nr:hypothetical protein [bacterium]
MTSQSPGILRIVAIPATLTLVVTVLRLVGELNGWDPTWFANEQPDPNNDAAHPGFVGIAYVVPLFGLWFGFRLRKLTGGPKHLGKAALLFVLGAGVLIGAFFGLRAAGLVTLPSEDAPGTPTGLEYALGAIALSLLVMTFAWPRLAGTLLLYGLLARIPVVVVTWIALTNGWDTHHVKLPPGTELPAGTGKLVFLATPQLTFWIAYTLFVGGLSGCLGAALARRK